MDIFQLSIYGIIGIIAVLFAAFLALLMLTRKRHEGQGLVSQVASGISQAKLIDKMPAAMPVEVVTTAPNTTAPVMPQAFDPSTGATMVTPQVPISPQVAQQESINNLADKVDQLNKKIDDATK